MHVRGALYEISFAQVPLRTDGARIRYVIGFMRIPIRGMLLSTRA